jgi:hypothetical protein
MQYLQDAREKYVRYFRGALRAKRNEGLTCTAEVWVQPNAPPGQRAPKNPLCIDIMTDGGDKPGMVMVNSGAIQGPLIETIRIKEVPVKVYALAWEDFAIWFKHDDPDWEKLDPWKAKWMDPNRGGSHDEDGLSGVVHFFEGPTAEGGGQLFSADFGSAPAEAISELLEILVDIGAAEIELGRSDGSDLPADVARELMNPDLSLQRLTELLGKLLAALPEVESVRQVSAEKLVVVGKRKKGEHQIILENLHRLLKRTGVEARALEVNRFLRGQREGMAPTRPNDLSQLRIVIKDDRFLANIRQLGPKMKPLVLQPLAGGLWQVCVWDAPNGMSFPNEDEPAKYGLSSEQMLERARENYLNERPKPELTQHGPLLVARTNDCYDATLLIDDHWIAKMAAKVSGELLACAPARNLLLLTGSIPASNANAMRKAAADIERGGDHLISNAILVRRGDQWEPFVESPVSPPGPPVPPVKPPNRWKFWK